MIEKDYSESTGSLSTLVRDEAFKSVAKYKGVAAILLKLAIPCFKEMDFRTVMESIVDRTERPKGLTLQQLATSEIDLRKTELGDGEDKNIRQDLVFDVKLPDGEQVVVVVNPDFTVNFEMQQKTLESELGYKVISRGMYYAAAMLYDTVPAGDTKYQNIHKVYTVWFCNGYLHLGNFGHQELDREFIHRYHMVRYYPELFPEKALHSNCDGSDLMEVIFVELPKMKKYGEDELYKVVSKLFYETKKFPEAIEKLAPGIDLGIVKEVEVMVNYDAMLREEEEKITAYVTAEVTAKITKEKDAEVARVTREKDAEIARLSAEIARLKAGKE